MKDRKKQYIDVSIRKFFDCKLKSGKEMKKAHLDESSCFQGIYFLKNTSLFRINLQTKKINKIEFPKNEDVLYITGNSNNDSIICILKSGKLIAIDQDQKVKIFQNLNILHLIPINTKQKELNFEKTIKIFANNFLDKVIIITESTIVIWYKNNFGINNSNNNEITGSFYTLYKETELLKCNIELKEFQSKSNIHNQNKVLKTSTTAVFSNNYFLGSHAKVFYVATEISSSTNYQKMRLVIMDYLFKFDYNFKYRSIPNNIDHIVVTYHNFYNTEEIEDLYEIKTKISESFIKLNEQESYMSLTKSHKIILKSNLDGNVVAIVLNFSNFKNNNIIFFMCETYQFSSCKLINIIGDKLTTYSSFIEISDIEWLANDMFLLVLFNTGTFFLMNINYQVILLNDLSNIILPYDWYYIPIYFNINKIKFDPNNNVMNEENSAKLIVSKQRDDIFFIYSKTYGISFQLNYKSYENRLISVQIPYENFCDLLYELKYLQLHVTSSDVEVSPDTDVNINVCEIIDKYLSHLLTIGLGNAYSQKTFSIGTSNTVSTNNNPNQKSVTNIKDNYSKHEDIINKTNQKDKSNITKTNLMINSSQKSETLNHIMKTFVKFIRIFRSINQLHGGNLTLNTYLLLRAKDFFVHLVNHQEIWLAVLFIELMEKYLCEPMKLTTKQNGNRNLTMQTKIFNPTITKNISFQSYKYFNNKIILSRMRLVLIFIFLFEFRNHLTLNINVLSFVIAKALIKKLKDNDLLDELLSVAKIIVKNYKYLKQENFKSGKDEFVLNSISMSYKNEIFSDIQITPNERDDLNFDFFSEFYSIDEFQRFNEVNKSLIQDDDINLINEFSYLNNVGILQKWIIYFTNYLYNELFMEFKLYLDNHLRQMLCEHKTEANTSPEEQTLSKLIYFNINFFLQSILIFLENYFNKIINHSYKNDELDYTPFISPVEIPFMIFEYYIQETNPNQNTLPFEIQINLSQLIRERSKDYNISLEDSMVFIDYLNANGICYEPCEIIIPQDDSNNMINYQGNQALNYIYSAFLFYLMTLHKLNLIYLLRTKEEMIYKIISMFDSKQKKECYEYLFLIVNGLLKYYLKTNTKLELNPNDSKFLEIILCFLKSIFYKMLREESFEIRNNLFDIIRATPYLMKSYLLEGAIYYEYKNFNKLIKEKLFSLKHDMNIQKNKDFQKMNLGSFTNIFDVLLAPNVLDTEINSNFICVLFDVNEKKFPKFVDNFVVLLNNLISLTLMPYPSFEQHTSKENTMNVTTPINIEFIFSLETNRTLIRKFIFAKLSELNDNGNQESQEQNNSRDNEVNNSSLDNEISLILDIILKGNLENNLFKFSNSELKQKLMTNIKHALAKILHLLSVINLKIKMYSCQMLNNPLLYLKYLSLCLLYDNFNPQFVYESIMNIIVFLASYKIKELKTDILKESFLLTLKHIHMAFLIYKQNDNMTQYLSIIDKKITSSSNQTFKEQYLQFHNETLPKIISIYNQLHSIKSQNLKNFIFSYYASDYYVENVESVVAMMASYLKKSYIIKQIPMRNAKKNYEKLSENYGNITGIPPSFFMDFKQYWNLTENTILYKSILLDEFTNAEVGEKEKSMHVMKRGQTPRKKEKTNEKGKTRRPRADSLEIREEEMKSKKKIKTRQNIPKGIPKSKESDKNIFNQTTQVDNNSNNENNNKPKENDRNIKLIKVDVALPLTSSNISTDSNIAQVEVILLKEKFVIYKSYIFLIKKFI